MSATTYQSSFVDITVSIANGGTTPTAPVLSGGLTPVAILFPAAMTSTGLTFTANNGSGTYKTVNGLTMTVTADNWVAFGSAWDALKLGNDWKPICGGAEGAARTLIVRCRLV